jgi:transposase
MATRQSRYPAEYRQRIVELVRSGKSPRALAREFDPSEQTIRNWVTQAALDEGARSDGATTDEKEELRKLRRENRRLLEEREILKKAAVWFAQETDSTSKARSSS